MGLVEILAGVQLYGYKPSAGRHQPAQAHLLEARRELATYLGRAGLRVKVSQGVGNTLPAVPWIAVLDPDVTSTAKSGLYLVYLFDAAINHVYLTMNQGATAHQAYYRKHSLEGLNANSAAILRLFDEAHQIRARLNLGADEYPRTIDLGSGGFLPRAYQAGTIAAVAYDLADLPSEAVLQADLLAFRKIYDRAVEVRKALNAENPEAFPTPTTQSPTPVTPAEEGGYLFQPKDASDYLAYVTEHLEHRSRKHESIVKQVGAYAATRGWTPVTKGQHPRDLVLRKDGAEVLAEVKIVHSNPEFAVRDAIGQLVCYKHFFYVDKAPRATLAVFSAPVGDAFVKMLEDVLGISSLWLTDTGWKASSAARAIGL